MAAAENPGSGWNQYHFKGAEAFLWVYKLHFAHCHDTTVKRAHSRSDCKSQKPFQEAEKVNLDKQQQLPSFTHTSPFYPK